MNLQDLIALGLTPVNAVLVLTLYHSYRLTRLEREVRRLQCYTPRPRRSPLLHVLLAVLIILCVLYVTACSWVPSGSLSLGLGTNQLGVTIGPR